MQWKDIGVKDISQYVMLLPFMQLSWYYNISLLHTKVYDEIIPISNEDAFEEGREFARTEGVLVGISSGAALKAALILAQRPENQGKNIVARYL